MTGHRFTDSRTENKHHQPPGTPIYTGDSPRQDTVITLIDYKRKDYVEEVVTDPQILVDYKEKPTNTWIFIEGLHQIDILEKIAKDFKIHPLILEDILNTHQRPKVQDMEDYLFVVLRPVRYLKDRFELDIEQISIIIGKNFVLTFAEEKVAYLNSLKKRIKDNRGRIRKEGCDYLAYAIMDSVVDNYFSVLHKFENSLEELEDELEAHPNPNTLQQINYLKRKAILLRRTIFPVREVIKDMRKSESPLIAKETIMFLGDVYDHTVQAVDILDNFRDLIGGMVDSYLSIMNYRMNEAIKVLTVISTIFIPMSFIAGLYGMNFSPEKSPYNMPELSWYYGYPFALFIMFLLGLGMLIYFKKKDLV